MKPENWVIVYDDLLKYYDANKENEEKLYFPTPKILEEINVSLTYIIIMKL